MLTLDEEKERDLFYAQEWSGFREMVLLAAHMATIAPCVDIEAARNNLHSMGNLLGRLVMVIDDNREEVDQLKAQIAKLEALNGSQIRH